MIKLKNILLFYLAIASLSARSETSLEWEQLRTSAAQSSRIIKQSKINLERASQQVDMGRSGFLPSVQASTSHNRSIDPKPVGTNDSNRASIVASQSLFSGFSDHAKLQKSKAQLESSKHQSTIASIEQRSLLRKAFDQAIYLQKAIIFAKKTEERREQNVRIVALRYEGGRENKSSLLRTEAAHLQATSDLKNYETNLRLTKLQIQNICGCSLPDGVVFAPNSSARSTEAIAIEQHPKYLAQKGQELSTRYAVDEARAGWMPRLTADAGVSRYGKDLRLEPENHFSVGLTLTVPLYNPAQGSAYREAAQSLAFSELELINTFEELKISFEQASAKQKDATSQVQVAEKVCDATRMQAEVYRQRYTLGMISFQDWDSVEAEFIRAEKDLLIAQLDFENATTDLESTHAKRLEDE